MVLCRVTMDNKTEISDARDSDFKNSVFSGRSDKLSTSRRNCIIPLGKANSTIGISDAGIFREANRLKSPMNQLTRKQKIIISSLETELEEIRKPAKSQAYFSEYNDICPVNREDFKKFKRSLPATDFHHKDCDDKSRNSASHCQFLSIKKSFVKDIKKLSYRDQDITNPSFSKSDRYSDEIKIKTSNTSNDKSKCENSTEVYINRESSTKTVHDDRASNASTFHPMYKSNAHVGGILRQSNKIPELGINGGLIFPKPKYNSKIQTPTEIPAEYLNKKVKMESPNDERRTIQVPAVVRFNEGKRSSNVSSAYNEPLLAVTVNTSKALSEGKSNEIYQQINTEMNLNTLSDIVLEAEELLQEIEKEKQDKIKENTPKHNVDTEIVVNNVVPEEINNIIQELIHPELEKLKENKPKKILKKKIIRRKKKVADENKEVDNDIEVERNKKKRKKRKIIRRKRVLKDSTVNEEYKITEEINDETCEDLEKDINKKEDNRSSNDERVSKNDG